MKFFSSSAVVLCYKFSTPVLKFTRKFFTSQFLGRAKAILYGNSQANTFRLDGKFFLAMHHGVRSHVVLTRGGGTQFDFVLVGMILIRTDG